MAWRVAGHAVAWYGELTLAVVFSAFASIEFSRCSTERSPSLGLMLHGLQVVPIVGVTQSCSWAWRDGALTRTSSHGSSRGDLRARAGAEKRLPTDPRRHRPLIVSAKQI